MIKRDRERKRRRKKQKSFCWIFLEDFFRSSNWVRKPGGPPPGKGGSARIEARPVFNMGPESETGSRSSGDSTRAGRSASFPNCFFPNCFCPIPARQPS